MQGAGARHTTPRRAAPRRANYCAAQHSTAQHSTAQHVCEVRFGSGHPSPSINTTTWPVQLRAASLWLGRPHLPQRNDVRVPQLDVVDDLQVGGWGRRKRRERRHWCLCLRARVWPAQRRAFGRVERRVVSARACSLACQHAAGAQREPSGRQTGGSCRPQLSCGCYCCCCHAQPCRTSAASGWAVLGGREGPNCCPLVMLPAGPWAAAGAPTSRSTYLLMCCNGGKHRSGQGDHHVLHCLHPGCTQQYLGRLAAAGTAALRRTCSCSATPALLHRGATHLLPPGDEFKRYVVASLSVPREHHAPKRAPRQVLHLQSYACYGLFKEPPEKHQAACQPVMAGHGCPPPPRAPLPPLHISDCLSEGYTPRLLDYACPRRLPAGLPPVRESRFLCCSAPGAAAAAEKGSSA